jgi:hypothetical protein
MDADTAACPHCAKVIEPRPRRARKCPHCREPLVVRKGELLPAGGTPSPAPKKEDAAPADPTPRFARFKMFRSSLTTWEALFAEAAEFASQLGPDRLITVSHSSDNGEGVVAVWYWEGPEWDGLSTPDDKPAGDS